MAIKNRYELVKQIEAYGLKSRLAEIAKKDELRRPFRHLPKQFSKGILIGKIAIVPKKSTGTRYIYVIADMVRAQILYDDIHLKQTAILVAHNIADNKGVPDHVLRLDEQFASHLFSITNSKRMFKMAKKERNEGMMEIQTQKFEDANRLADEYKQEIMNIFTSTFSR
ncbi:uncharacterized protein METZ01_LOCUS184640 [marine metagenome]|uniref:Uncharacterized protein n=1 Tax=marine metagenome TaxID=408172 RepID=A0A382CZW8_9ZZZZ